MASKGALYPPPGGDVNIGYKLEVGTTVTFLCALVVVVLRTVTRIVYANLGWDDYLMLFASVSACFRGSDIRPHRANKSNPG
jgi:hypothetical protein